MGGQGYRRCSECATGIFTSGNGKCSKCFGTGANTALNSPDPTCPNCKGTGSCPNCGGTGFEPKRGRRLPLAIGSFVALVVIGSAYCGYSQRKYVPMATSATNTFHLRFSAAQDDLIYAESDPAYARAIDPDTNRSFFARIRRKMGHVLRTRAPWAGRSIPTPTAPL